MKNFDLLYPSEEKRIQGRKKSISKSLLSDLQMHEFVKNGLMEESDYQFLMTEMEYLPTDQEIIAQMKSVLESDAIQYRVSYTYGKVIQYLEIDMVHSDQMVPTIKKRGLLKKI